MAAIYALVAFLARPIGFLLVVLATKALIAFAWWMGFTEGVMTAVNLAMSDAAIVIGQLILAASDRDTRGLHAKLDALISCSNATNELIAIERADPKAIEETRQRAVDKS